MDNNIFWSLIRCTNNAQKSILFEVIFHLATPNQKPLQLFLTGPAGCGKTFVIKLIMECYNRFT